MPLRIAINGFGRIGRTILRLLSTARAGEGIEIACINDIAPLESCAYLFEYDSVFGPYQGEVATEAGALVVDGRAIPFHNEADLSRLDLSGVDIVLECTGRAESRAIAMRGLDAGAGRVLISGPSAAAEATVVRGANDDVLAGQGIVSCGSCTTNALAPLLRLLDDRFGLISGHMTTIHCYTGSQPTVDAPRPDPARSRAAALSMVPTTTSATRLTATVLPDLAGRVTGRALRVPVASVSSVDLVVRLRDRDGFEPRLREAVAKSPVLGWTDRPLVSTDLRARPESLVLAGPETEAGPDLVRLFGWYDNEWGFSNRMIDLALRMGATAGRS
ncbi:type I glyceraldehyde-3-phosphate dehydrogenase [Limimaricola pyoseonensis]|uniref:Glyceraldehyde 3-phosphate dehydrogenase n=1 Tax=Limimaricola pyoseonensis TaxID=521013 RepID=A0A1G7FVT6_9RHOB|nr:glyceraldehyde 3-phosphate dehydrogenase NAD-binding domain-containing protein [Limimaricola pyoseonensis]SDE79988.1 glyceraldehyde 3-phosphate dehydrogenase [Limimaricola pyoseonensis]